MIDCWEPTKVYVYHHFYSRRVLNVRYFIVELSESRYVNQQQIIDLVCV